MPPPYFVVDVDAVLERAYELLAEPPATADPEESAAPPIE
jgi:hypothetical protein